LVRRTRALKLKDPIELRLGSISAKNPPPAPPGAGANFCRFYSIEK
jgi:hypothetical protein